MTEPLTDEDRPDLFLGRGGLTDREVAWCQKHLGFGAFACFLATIKADRERIERLEAATEYAMNIVNKDDASDICDIAEGGKSQCPV